MYENNYKNPELTGLMDLENFLQLIADLDEELELFAIGGTAMVLKGIKESTKDIDFLTTAKYERIKYLFQLAGLKEESTSQLCNIWHLKDTRIDLFYSEFILGYPLPEDWKKLSEHRRTIGKVKLFILNWYDIIITKIARSERRDIEDGIAIIKHEKLDFEKLKQRYYLYAETAIISDYDYKFQHFEMKWNQK
jgi:hypothetical protein